MNTIWVWFCQNNLKLDVRVQLTEDQPMMWTIIDSCLWQRHICCLSLVRMLSVYCMSCFVFRDENTAHVICGTSRHSPAQTTLSTRLLSGQDGQAVDTATEDNTATGSPVNPSVPAGTVDIKVKCEYIVNILTNCVLSLNRYTRSVLIRHHQSVCGQSQPLPHSGRTPWLDWTLTDTNSLHLLQPTHLCKNHQTDETRHRHVCAA